MGLSSYGVVHHIVVSRRLIDHNGFSKTLQEYPVCCGTSWYVLVRSAIKLSCHGTSLLGQRRYPDRDTSIKGMSALRKEVKQRAFCFPRFASSQSSSVSIIDPVTSELKIALRPLLFTLVRSADVTKPEVCTVLGHSMRWRISD
jgi:hypothetical protein